MGQSTCCHVFPSLPETSMRPRSPTSMARVGEITAHEKKASVFFMALLLSAWRVMWTSKIAGNRSKKGKQIPYVDSEILYKPSTHIGVSSVELKGKKGPELPVGEDGLPVFESPVISPQYQLPRARLTKEQRLDLLEERLLLGEVSEETYKELKTKIESSKEEPDKEKEIEEKELGEAEVEQEEMVKEDKELEVEDIEERESEEAQEAISETVEKETEEYELAAEDIKEVIDSDLELKEQMEPEPETEVVPVVTGIEKAPKTKKKKIPKKKKKVKMKKKEPIVKDDIDVENYEHELEESQRETAGREKSLGENVGHRISEEESEEND